MFCLILGHGPSSLTLPGLGKGSKRTTRVTERWRSAGAGGLAGRCVVAANRWCQCAASAPAPFRLTAQAIRKIAHRYREAGLERALYERPRPGPAEILEDAQKQRIIAMVCSQPPEGRARWTVRLVAEQAVKRKLVPRVGRETIRILLESHDLKPWREKNVVRGRTR